MLKNNTTNSAGNNRVITVSAVTHNGKVRPHNEDNFFINGTPKGVSTLTDSFESSFCDNILAEVCDGMGGEANGELASKIAVDEMSNMYNVVNEIDIGKLSLLINKYANNANLRICQMLENSKSSRGGSTFALVYIKDNVAYPFSLGDSRIYLYRSGALNQVSTDHTLAMRKYNANIYTKEEAENSPDSHKLTLFLGVDYQNNGLEAETYDPIELQPGDKILLCSDGLYDMCSQAEIESVLANSNDSANDLVNLALKNGGTDNVTCIVISCAGSGSKSRYDNLKLNPMENKAFESVANNRAPQEDSTNSEKPAAKSKLTLLLCILTAIAIVLLLIVLYVLLFNNKDDKKEKAYIVTNDYSSVFDISSSQEESVESSMQDSIYGGYLSDSSFVDESSFDINDSSSVAGSQYKTKISADGKYRYKVLPKDTVEIVKYIGTDTYVTISDVDGKTVSKIGNYAFANNTTIQSITLPGNIPNDNNITFGKGAFKGCSNLTLIDNTSRYLKRIYDETFEGCTSLEILDIADSQVTVIGKNAFSGCSSLSELKLPDSVTSIDLEAFGDCEKLTIYSNSDYISTYATNNGIKCEKNDSDDSTYG